MRTASVRRTVAAALVAGALGTTAGVAQAAPQQDDFATTETGKTTLVGNAVELATFNQDFNGAALPWPAVQFSALSGCATDGGATMTGTALAVDGARVDSAKGNPGSSLKFRATFGAQRFAHVGFGFDFDTVNRWAMFSTNDTSDKIFARVHDGTTGTAVEVPGVTPGNAYDFRIDWADSGTVKFYVDGALVPGTPTAPVIGAMTAQVSDCLKDAAGATPVTVDSMLLRAEKSGTYTSKVFNAGNSRIAGITFTPEAETLNNTTISYESRTSSDNVTWTAWGPTSATQPAQYFQYRANLTTPDTASTPRLTKASVDFQITPAPQPGPGTQPPGGNTGGDTKKAKIGMPRDADVTKRGKVRLLLTCPDDETRCNVALKFKWNGDTVASKSGKIDGGDSRYITLKLSKAAKKKLAKAGKLKVVATLTVTDAAGNKRTSSKRIWLYSL